MDAIRLNLLLNSHSTMIRIDKTELPEFFTTPQVQGAIKAWNKSHEIDISAQRQRRASFLFPYLPELRAALLRESHYKCVYCEQRITSESRTVIDHYRPISGAIDARGGRSEFHYYWLAYEWTNMFAACSECNLAKGNKFPVASQRVDFRINGALDATEHPLILNPTDCDPKKHLELLPDGTLVGKTIEGRHTIDVLKLNRQDLLERRTERTNILLSLPEPDLATDILSRNAEFSGMLNLFVDDLAKTRGGKRSPTFRDIEPSKFDESTDTEVQDFPDFEETEEQRYYSTFPLISSIAIDGVFGFSSLTIDIPPSIDGRPSCLALLGENGVGKSCILKAISIALYDGDLLNELGLDASELLNPEAESGTISIRFDTQETTTFSISRDGSTHRPARHMALLMLAYGATRLLPTPHHPTLPEQHNSRARNLFDSYAPLRSPSDWLRSLSPEQFDYAAAAIKSLLNLRWDYYLCRTDTDSIPIELQTPGESHPLERLSHGYRSMLALACDIMATLFERWESIEAAQGIVLIDELENHLHPTWKMRVISSLRAAFPRVQFVVTTHDPLCLRGFEAGEVALLRRSKEFGHKTEVIQGQLPSVTDMRIDQILTSSYFGLDSTVDPSVELLFKEYYSLLEDEDSLDMSQRKQLEELKRQTKKFDLPALRPRDRVMYAVIDRYLARSNPSVPDDNHDFDKDLLNVVDKIIESLSNGENPRDD